MSFNDENDSYYIPNIIKITSQHPKINELYKKRVPSWAARKVLESPWISDASKINSIRYFDPEGADALDRGVAVAKIAHKGVKTVDKLASEYISSTEPTNEAAEQSYALHKINNYGGKKYKKTTKKRIKKGKRKNKTRNK